MFHSLDASFPFPAEVGCRRRVEVPVDLVGSKTGTQRHEVPGRSIEETLELLISANEIGSTTTVQMGAHASTSSKTAEGSEEPRSRIISR